MTRKAIGQSTTKNLRVLSVSCPGAINLHMYSARNATSVCVSIKTETVFASTICTRTKPQRSQIEQIRPKKAANEMKERKTQIHPDVPPEIGSLKQPTDRQKVKRMALTPGQLLATQLVQGRSSSCTCLNCVNVNEVSDQFLAPFPRLNMVFAG